MLKITNIKINKANSEGYYVGGSCLDENQILMEWDEDDDSVYLHKDGIWRRSTFNKETQKFSGYFDTWDEAEQALTDYLYKE